MKFNAPLLHLVLQMSSMQMEMKSMKCINTDEHKSHIFKNEVSSHHPSHMRHSYFKHPLYQRIEERLTGLERKISIVAKKRGVLEKRVVYENGDYLRERVIAMEARYQNLSRDVANVSSSVDTVSSVSKTMIQLFETVESLEDKMESTKTETIRELAQLDLKIARKSAELSLAGEEVKNLKRTVQALSVSASKSMEKNDYQEKRISTLNETIAKMDLEKALNITHELEHVEDEYRSMVDSLPGNCEDRDGLTLLAPGQGAPLMVSCHKGWIAIARRLDGMVEFDRSWNEYASGFGSPVNEFWIGNEAMHKLTRDNCSRLRIDMVDIYGNHWNADYENFVVDSEEMGYRLHVSGYSGNATDALSYQDGMAFSTKDRDMDISSADCAANYHGGWWFSHCQHANLNAKYTLGLTWFKSDNNEWIAVTSSVMSIQTKPDCEREHVWDSFISIWFYKQKNKKIVSLFLGKIMVVFVIP